MNLFLENFFEKKHVKNTGIPVFTGIVMAVYRYSVFAISIHSRFFSACFSRVRIVFVWI